MMPGMQYKPTRLAKMNRLIACSVSMLSGSSLRKGGGLNFRCASVKSRGLMKPSTLGGVTNVFVT